MMAKLPASSPLRYVNDTPEVAVTSSKSGGPLYSSSTRDGALGGGAGEPGEHAGMATRPATSAAEAAERARVTRPRGRERRKRIWAPGRVRWLPQLYTTLLRCRVASGQAGNLRQFL